MQFFKNLPRRSGTLLAGTALLMSAINGVPQTVHSPGTLPEPPQNLLAPRLNLAGPEIDKSITTESLLRQQAIFNNVHQLSSGENPGAGGGGLLDAIRVKTAGYEWFHSVRDGDQIDIAVPGGGGDTLGAIDQAGFLKVCFGQMGKSVHINIIFTNIKYGKDNPTAGPLPVKYISGEKPLTWGKHGHTKYFYKITGKITVSVPQQNRQNIALNYTTEWGEGKEYRRLKKDDITLVMMDLSPPVNTLRSDYRAWVDARRTKKSSVHTVILDMGGDVLAQIQKLTHPNGTNAYLASPVSDDHGLSVFSGMDGAILMVNGIGFDGEQRIREQRNSLIQLKTAFIGAMDLPAMLRSLRRQEETDAEQSRRSRNRLRTMKSRMKAAIRSEVSGAFRKYIEKESFRIPEQDPERFFSETTFNFGAALDARCLDVEPLRYDKRIPEVSALSGYSLLFDARQVSRITKRYTPQLDDDRLNWHAREQAYQALGITTEVTGWLIHRSIIKQLSKRFAEMLLDKKTDISVKKLYTLFRDERNGLYLRLAAARAIAPAASGSGSQIDSASLRTPLLNILERQRAAHEKEYDIFFIAELFKTIGIIGVDDLIRRNGGGKALQIAGMIHEYLRAPDRYGIRPFLPGISAAYAQARRETVTQRALLKIAETFDRHGQTATALHILTPIVRPHEKLTAVQRGLSGKLTKQSL